MAKRKPSEPSYLKAPEAKWEEMQTTREPYLRRARECAALTIPSLFPPKGFTTTSDLPTPYQGLGARGLNNLASKLLLSLFPPNSSFFRLKIEERLLNEMAAVDEKIPQEVEKSLIAIERQVNESIEAGGMRVAFFEAFKHLVTAGNVLFHLPKEGVRIFRLDQYCVKRDSVGNVIDIVTQEVISEDALPPDVKELVESDETLKDDEEITLWTCIHRESIDSFSSYQQIGKNRVPGSEGAYSADELPWNALRMSSVSGEDYGRGIVEEYKGDLRSLEGLTKAIVQGAAASARLVGMVKPNSSTRRADLAKAENGDIITGNAEDVSFLQVQKFNDFRVAADTSAAISLRLSAAFLLNSAVQRNAERVTAEEIRYMAQELEEALGGVYTVLAQEFQLPLLRRVLARLRLSGEIPNLPEKGVRPIIITGVQALGRGHEMNRLQIYSKVMIESFGPQAMAAETNIDQFSIRLANAIGIDPQGLVKTPEQKAQEQQQALMSQMALKAAGPVAGNVSGAMAGSAFPQDAPQPQ